MEKLGKWLRERREQKNISLGELSQKTKLTKRQLRALEEENFDVFNADVYLKGALKKFAEEVGLNPHEVLEKYRQLYTPRTD